MSIDDDFYDIEARLKKTGLQSAFERFSKHTANLEKENERLLKENGELKTTLKWLKVISDQHKTFYEEHHTNPYEEK